MKKILIIGHRYPESSTTAAGSRMMQLIAMFKELDFIIDFASTASISEKSVDLTKENINIHSIKINHNSFDVFLKKTNPDIVMFDRFITEEQFGWRVADQCPSAVRILDTEDLHFLRKAREQALKTKGSIKSVELYSETTKREIASIYRCDLSLIISEVEMDLLQHTFLVDTSLLFYMPFVISEQLELNGIPSFEDRSHFITIGNLLHSPNVDSVLHLKKTIWPLIKKSLPEAAIHIYGAYAPQQIRELHNEKEGFLIKGWAQEVSCVMKHARVCLAPLRYGAGLKGKIIDAMIYGTPCVTTSIGEEGLSGCYPFSGFIADNEMDYVLSCVKLYTKKNIWKEAQSNGFTIIGKRFKKELFFESFKGTLQLLLKNLNLHRNKNFFGQLLQLQNSRATKYMSMWIEEKNKHVI